MDNDLIRKRLRHFFHSNSFHYILAAVIVVDLAIVLTDIILLLSYCEDIPNGIEQVVDRLLYVSLTILGLFIIELSVQMYAFGIKKWCEAPLHIFDFGIVFVTFILEIVLHQHLDRVETTVGLLVGFRLWRLVRVVHVTTEALELKYETEMDLLKQKMAVLKGHLAKYKEANPEMALIIDGYDQTDESPTESVY